MKDILVKRLNDVAALAFKEDRMVDFGEAYHALDLELLAAVQALKELRSVQMAWVAKQYPAAHAEAMAHLRQAAAQRRCN